MQIDLKTIPTKPGIYKYFDNKGKIIYVGKAKNLQKRISSYFNKEHTDMKTIQLVNNIDKIEFTIVNTEKEALILELNLIQNFKPKYNILLKDDRSFPYIKLTKEEFPRLQLIRKLDDQKNAIYFGPFPNSWDARETLNLLNRLYPLRKCHPIPKTKCIYYDIKQCYGPCINKIDPSETKGYVDKIKLFFKGNFKDIEFKLKNEMNSAAEKLEFEKAGEIKKLLNNITSIKEKQVIQSSKDENFDVIGYYQVDNLVSVYYLFIRQGRVISSYDYINDEDNNMENIIFMPYLANKFTSEYKIITNLKTKYDNFKIINPKQGKKNEILDIAIANAKQQLDLKLASKENYNYIINKLTQKIHIKNINKIECYDNSHFSGQHNSSSLVVYINGEKQKNLYRRYLQPDNTSDYHMMENVLTRRYKKLDASEYPELIVLDGGKAQVAAAKEIFNLLKIDIPVIGLAKDDKHRTSKIIFKGKEIEIEDRKLLTFLSNLQEEVHRYAISFTAKKLKSANLKSFFDDIKGIGPKKKLMLQKEFSDISKIIDLDLNSLTKLGLNDESARLLQSKAILYYNNAKNLK